MDRINRAGQEVAEENAVAFLGQAKAGPCAWAWTGPDPTFIKTATTTKSPKVHEKKRTNIKKF